jgi:hypothetical protein
MKIVKLVATDEDGVEHTFEGTGHLNGPMNNHQEKRPPYTVFQEVQGSLRLTKKE